MRLCRVAYFVVILSGALSLSPAPAQAQSVDFQMQVTDDFGEGGLNARSMPDPYTMRYTFLSRDGRVAICGIGYYRDNRLRSNIRRMLRNAELTVDGQVYPVNLTYFAQARSAQELDTGMANCAITAAPVPRTRSGFGFRLGDAGTFRN